MEGHATAQLEAPDARIGRVLFPGFRERRPQAGHLISAGKIPAGQCLKGCIAKKAHTFEAVIRHAGGGRHICRRHGDAQRLWLLLRLGACNAKSHQGGGERRAPKTVLPSHILSPIRGSAGALP